MVFQKGIRFFKRKVLSAIASEGIQTDASENASGHGSQEYAGRIFAYSRIFLAFDAPRMQLHISEKSKC